MADLSGDEHESRSGGDDRLEMPDLNDKPTYLLEHLATFTVNKESGILYPADGMRRLLQLEKTTGIWSQKMQLCLDYQWVLIMDYETGNIIERFPASLIQEPTAFTSTDAMELYNNILVFIVSGGNGSRSEMHIFQSQNVSAVHLVEDLKQLRNGKVVTKQREPQTHQGSQISVGLRAHQQHSQHHSHQQITHQHQHSSHHQRSANNSLMEQYSDFVHKSGNNAAVESESELGGGGAFNDETSSTSSDKYERDVTVLNHCFDDIEKFIARLQHAAAASRELERRRRNRKSKKRDPGEGLLTLRTRPPHEKEFIDIFAKFKLSFNLLAKLKAHIHDPNAPELVHFLFTPLALIVEAASDTYYDAQIPAHVVNPLLTREAINLLINCVTSKETELWRSLGEAWTVPRDQWKDEIGSYHPVFLDGWSPDYLVVDEPEQIPATPMPNSKRQIVEAVTVHHQHNADFAGGNGTNADFSTRSEISIDSIERSGLGAGAVGGTVPSGAMMQSLTSGIQNLHTTTRNVNSENNNNFRSKAIASNDEQALEAWLDELQSVGAKIVVVTYPRTANNDKELSVVRGEYLEILDDTRKWWKARNIRGQIAHVPHTIVAPYNYGETSPSSSQFYGQPQQLPKESVEPRSIDTTDWIRKKHLGKKGFDELDKQHPAYHEYAVPMRVSFGNTVSIPPSPKVGGNGMKEISLQQQRSKQNNTNGASSQLSMQDELRHVLHMRIRATPSVFIDQKATPLDVENWLIAKKFSPLITQSLSGLSGEELFRLMPKQFEDQFGAEGRRLNSQLKLQRSVSGYKTSRSCELETVLRRNRPAINF